MDIQINGCRVDFELERERMVGEVIHHLSDWARERDLIFVEAQVDGARYEHGSVPEMALDGVSVINCVIQSKADVVISSLEEAISYCQRAVAFLEKGPSADEGGFAEELSGGISWLYDVVRSVLSLLELRGEDLRSRDLSMEEYLAQAMEFRKSLGNGYAADLPGLAERGVRLFSGLREMLKTVLLGDAMKRLVVRSIESPDVLMKSLRESSEGLPAQLANIEETSAAYQTGKDELASERLKAFIDYIHRYIRMCHQIAPVFRIDPAGIQVGGLSLEQKNRGIQELLGRMLEALENNDIITLSDILEYELKPMLQDLGAYLDSLEKAVKAA